MPPAGLVRSQISRKGIPPVRRKDPRVDIAVAIGPEAGAVARDHVVGHIGVGEWPEQWPDPAIAAVVMPPPPARAAAALPAGQCRGGSDLSARRRGAKRAAGIAGNADILRPERRGLNGTVVTRAMVIGAAQSSH